MIEVWSMDGCGWCTKVCDLLRGRGISFEERKPSVSELRSSARIWNFTTLPQVFDEEGTLIGGYTETAAYLQK